MNKTMRALATLGVAGIAALAVALGGSPSSIHPPDPDAPTAIIVPTVPHTLITTPKACVKVPASLTTACITLYHRKPETQKNSDGSIISNPAGPALVQECTSQYHDIAELKPCLEQPHI